MSTKTFFHPTQNLFFWQKVRIPLFGLLMIFVTESISGQAMDCGSGIISDVPDQGLGNCIDNLAILSPICEN